VSGVAKFGAAAIEAIQRQRWLDTPGYKLEHGLALTFNLLGARSRAVQDVLHGRWLGHPLHPTLTSLPIGAWTAAVVLDAVDVVSSQGEGFRRAAQFAVGLGVLGGAGAALTGVTDWQHTQDKPRRSGLVHGLVNSVALGLNILSFHQRRRGRPAGARLASVAGYGFVVAGGYLGGDLVFRHRIGVDHSQQEVGSNRFVAVMAEADLAEDAPMQVQCDGAAVVLIRHEDQITAVGQWCSHLAGPMSQGWVYRGQLVCPWHGSRFSLKTGCPTTGPAVAPLTRFETRVVAGLIEVRRIPAISAGTSAISAGTSSQQPHTSGGSL